MQVLKPELREAILKAAERRFLRSGFAGVPMRRIADDVRISVSALYKYFVNKRALFGAIAEPFVRETRSRAAALFAEEHHVLDDRVAGLAAGHLAQLIRADPSRFVIVVGRSAGTRYAGFAQEFVEMLAGHLRASIARERLKDDFMLRVFAESFVAALLRIAERAGQDGAAVEDDVLALMRYHLGGLAQFERITPLRDRLEIAHPRARPPP